MQEEKFLISIRDYEGNPIPNAQIWIIKERYKRNEEKGFFIDDSILNETIFVLADGDTLTTNPLIVDSHGISSILMQRK